MDPDLLKNLFDQGGLTMVLIAVASIAAWALVLRSGFITQKLLTRIEQTSATSTVRVEVEKLDKSLSIIKTITVILPLLGLLGTVLGMLVTFAVIQKYGTTRPAFFANGIRQALLTTQAGLCTALPLLFSHHLLDTRLRAVISRMHLLTQAANNSKNTDPT